jgi:cytochrome c-type biogenesis protein CcmH/NrfF
MRSLLKASLLVALCALFGLAQNVTTGDEHYNEYVAVGAKLKCQCGCSYTIAHCNMLNCHYREMVRPEIMTAVTAGLPTDEIVEKMVAMFGSELRTSPRSEGFGRVGWAMPFVALVLGLILAPVVIARWKKQQPVVAAAAARVSEKDLARFRETIERDLSRLE